jgi:hypothetical protein
MPTRVNISWKDKSGQTFSLEIDATTNEQHDATNTVTDHPVEKGANIADHVRPDPDVLSVTGTISNTPIHLPKDHNGGAREASSFISASWKGSDSRGTAHGVTKTLGDLPLPIPHLIAAIPIGGGDEAHIGRVVPGGQSGANVKTFSTPFDRVKDCDQALLKIRNDGTLCRVITDLRTYEDMAITSYSVPRTPEQGDALVFTIAFKHIAAGTAAVTKIPALNKISKGAVSKVEPPAAPPAKMSALRGLVTGH